MKNKSLTNKNIQSFNIFYPVFYEHFVNHYCSQLTVNFLQTQDFKKTKAAEQLCISHPSLSHAIAQLAKELGIPLFEKTEEIQP